jgi:hypothetical protein
MSDKQQNNGQPINLGNVIIYTVKTPSMDEPHNVIYRIDTHQLLLEATDQEFKKFYGSFAKFVFDRIENKIYIPIEEVKKAVPEMKDKLEELESKLKTDIGAVLKQDSTVH